MIRKKALEIASDYDLSQPLLRIYDNIIGLPGGADIKVDFEKKSMPGKNGRIIFPHSAHGKVQTYRDCILARKFELHGFSPLFVISDGCLPINTSTDPNNIDNNISDEIRKYNTKKTLQKFGYDWITLSEFVPSKKSYNNIDTQKYECSNYRDIKISNFAEASTRKVLKRYSINSEQSKNIEQLFLRSAMQLVDAYENIVDSFNIITMIAHDDKYNQGGIPLNVAANNDIHAYSSTFGWMNESLVMGNITDRNSLPHYEEEQLVERFLERPLDSEQLEQVNEIMSDRMGAEGNQDQVRARYSAQTAHSIDSSNNNFKVGMFTNLIWDANMEVDNCPYPNVFNWIRDTISELGGRPDIDLIIKPHPAEYIRGTNEPVRDWIYDSYADLPENVTVLNADTDVNTYRMISDIDVGIVYNSTVGFEMVYAGTPVITAGETHYRNLSISHDPATSEEYVNSMKNIAQIGADEQRQQRAKRYIYFLLKGKHLKFPFIKTITTEQRSYKFEPVSDSDIRNTKSLDQIVKRCTNGQPVLIPELDWLLK